MIPDAFIQLAEHLSKESPAAAACYRTATSRAYYGAYLTVRALIRDEFGISCRIDSQSSDHQSLAQLLANSQVTQTVQIGYRLSNLHDSRKLADYDMNYVDVEDAQASADAVQRAKYILSLLDQCRLEPTRSQLIAGSIQYRKLLGLSPR